MKHRCGEKSMRFAIELGLERRSLGGEVAAALRYSPLNKGVRGYEEHS
jgi:hypothetical protein